MSTRCNILFKDGKEKLWFYRHSDGYPECAGKDLELFVKNYTDNVYRLNIGQSAGHLIVRGHNEYAKYTHNLWKVGAYEPTTGQHGDIDYLYTIDLQKRVLSIKDIHTKKTIKKVSF